MDLGFEAVSTDDLLDQITAACEVLAARAGPDSALAAMEQAGRLVRALDLAEAGLATLVAEVDASGVFKRAGFPSTVAWLRSGLAMRHGRASERVAFARQLQRLERTAALLVAGRLSADEASAICQAAVRLDDADAADAEDILLGMVEDGCTVQQIGRAGDRITDLIRQRRGQEPEPEDSQCGFKRSWLTTSKSLDGGCWVKGWFHAEHAAAFDEIIGPLAQPTAQGDDRDLAERTADALFSVLTSGNKGAGVTIVIDLAAYAAATAPTGPQQASSASGPTAHGPGESTPARLLDGTPISVMHARRIALSAGINALILGRGGLPLYLGRTVRFASAAQRKALLVLYETCCVVGCPIPAHLSEIHHLNGGWKLGTPTDIDQLAPVCGWHNRFIDDHPQRIAQRRDARGRVVIAIQSPWGVREAEGVRKIPTQVRKRPREP